MDFMVLVGSSISVTRVTTELRSGEEGVAGVKEVKISKEQLSEISDPRAREIARILSELNDKEIRSLGREKKDGTMDYSAIETLKKVKILHTFIPCED